MMKMELPECPVETILMVIGDKWKVLIPRDLMNRTMRLGELKKSIDHVSQKMLTAQLRDMEAKGLVIRKVFAELPPRVEYTLMEIGYSLEPVLDAMSVWGEAYKAKTNLYDTAFPENCLDIPLCEIGFAERSFSYPQIH